MDLLVADRAVLITGIAQIVKRRWNHSHRRISRARSRQIGVTLETHQAHFMTDQRPRIGGAVWLVAGRAVFETYRGMIEGERPALIAMATETTGFIRRKYLSHAAAEAAVRVVAIDAVHRILHQPVAMRLLERGPDAEVTGCA